MTPYTRKLQQALLDIGHQVEGNKDKPAPTAKELELLIYNFLLAIDGRSMKNKANAVKELIGELVRWEMVCKRNKKSIIIFIT